MERVILVLALLAELHLVLSFLRWVVQPVQDWLLQKPEPTVTPEPVPEARAGWGGGPRSGGPRRSRYRRPGPAGGRTTSRPVSAGIGSTPVRRRRARRRSKSSPDSSSPCGGIVPVPREVAPLFSGGIS